MNAPYSHTWLEIVAARWGRVAHLVFMFFGRVELQFSKSDTTDLYEQTCHLPDRQLYARARWFSNRNRPHWHEHNRSRF